jgi:hypothetical protein
MLGPKQQLLASYLTSADDSSLDGASTQWKTGEGLLRRLATELDTKSGNIGKDERFSGESANAASQAFAQSAKKMNDRADQMRDGSGAFTAAAHAVRQARKASTGFSQHSGDQPPQQPPDLSDVKAQHDWKTQNNTFWHNYNSREGEASDAISALQDNHRTQAAVFAKIHGEAPPTSPNSNGGGTTNPIRPGTPYTPTHVPTQGVAHEHTTSHDHQNTNTGNSNHDHDKGSDNPTSGSHNGPNADNGHPGNVNPGSPGLPQGPHPYGTTPPPSGPGLPGTITPPGSAVGGGIGAAGGVGAVAGGALGGAAAAGLAGGLTNINGGLNGVVGVGGIRGGLSASGVRGIGATSRIGAGSVLGRSTGATSRGGTGGMSSRSTGRGGSRTAGTRGARGRSGSRGSGAGAGAGRNGKDKKRAAEEHDLFDDGSDWIDDEDAAPGLLD